ncbi:oligopeptide:H+ symporter [Rothia sp. P100]|uniref:peptide MFS transporter n=1 Tax=Rothia sp. P100 TaxID=2939578 RepID=UPI0020423847|nr:oligopeptide:H+ symporter [Rothia sp. P100]MCM3509992.1 oligopeptide:H+ symporter [Rothia sp. P100]
MTTPALRPTPEDAHNPSGKTFFGHPRMLASLFSVELWERFSFYGMQVIMLYYLYWEADRGGLGLLSEASASSVMGAYGGMVYLMAVVGGFLGDRVFGPERTLFYSAFAIMAGHLALAVLPGAAGVIAGLVLVAIGSGGLKTNASVLVGSLYDRTDPRRDGGFTIFYIGVNIGAFFGPMLTGILRESYGFHIAFGLAAAGMAIGLIQYSLTRKNLPASVHQLSEPMNASEKKIYGSLAVVIVAAVLVLVMTGLINPANLATWVMTIVAISAAVLFYTLLTSKHTTVDEHSRVVSFIPMFIGNVAFWALFQQQFTVLAIYSESRINWNIMGLQFTPEFMNSINPVFIMIFGAVFTAMWTKLGDRQPTTPVKFSLALILIGLAFLIFLTQAGNTNVNFLWIVLILFICTMGELAISPVGTSLATKLAPEKHRVAMVALYFTSVSLGTVLAGWLGRFYTMETEVAYFTTLGVVTIIIGAVLWAMNKWIVKKMAGVR